DPPLDLDGFLLGHVAGVPPLCGHGTKNARERVAPAPGRTGILPGPGRRGVRITDLAAGSPECSEFCSPHRCRIWLEVPVEVAGGACRGAAGGADRQRPLVRGRAAGPAADPPRADGRPPAGRVRRPRNPVVPAGELGRRIAATSSL